MSGKNGSIVVTNVLTSAAVTATTTTATADCKGYDALTFAWMTGTNTDFIGTFSLTYSDDDVTYTAVDAGDVYGGSTALVATDDNIVRQFGVVVKKRYYRAVLTKTSATTGTVIGCVAVKGNPNNRT